VYKELKNEQSRHSISWIAPLEANTTIHQEKSLETFPRT
jgi:hypothetical protein